VDDSPNAWPQNPNVWYFNKFMQITVGSLRYVSRLSYGDCGPVCCSFRVQPWVLQ
jgi:hypothetical protein